MKVQRILGFLALLLVDPAFSKATALHRKGETLSLRGNSDTASGEEDAGSAELDHETSRISAATSDNSEELTRKTIKRKSVNVWHRDAQVSRLQDERAVKRFFMNSRLKQGQRSGVDVSVHSKVPSLTSVSNVQENPERPATNIEADPAVEKPSQKSIVGSINVPNTRANVGATTNTTELVKELDPFEQDCLESHNSYRAKHGVPPLMWSSELAESAQKWADQLASNDVMKHDEVAMKDNKLGENLAHFTPPSPKCERAVISNCVMCREMVQRWYDEIKNYNFDKGQSKSLKTPYKHFSQIVWSNTAEMGVGTAVSKKFGFITVARYKPMGNEGGADEFVKNVPPDGGPLPTVDSSFEEASGHSGTSEPAEPTKTEPSSLLSVTSVAQSSALSAAHRTGFVHTVTAADGSEAQVYLSKKGNHAGIVFRDQISRAHSSDEEVLSRTIQVL